MLAQGRGCLWSTKDDMCPKHFVGENEASRDAPMYGCGCCGIRKLDTSLDSQKGSYQYRRVCDLDKLRLKSVSLEEHLERLKDDSMVIDLPINDNNDKKTFELWKVHSIWPQMRDAKNYYYLHP